MYKSSKIISTEAHGFGMDTSEYKRTEHSELRYVRYTHLTSVLILFSHLLTSSFINVVNTEWVIAKLPTLFSFIKTMHRVGEYTIAIIQVHK